MQGLDLKKHQSMLKAIHQFEELLAIYEHIVSQDHDRIVRDNIAEFKGSYDYYCLLLKELEGCIGTYKELHESLQRMVFPYVRKMNTQERNKRS